MAARCDCDVMVPGMGVAAAFSSLCNTYLQLMYFKREYELRPEYTNKRRRMRVNYLK